ncbi:Protein of unknown function [Pyronema omphalodes CBS 100304]|nr:Protein of unknown function [Pyronema omphalodes CBS 100304]
MKLMFTFGVRVILLGFGSMFFHDAARDGKLRAGLKERDEKLRAEVKEFVKETVANSERVLLSEMRRLEDKINIRGRWWQRLLLGETFFFTWVV